MTNTTYQTRTRNYLRFQHESATDELGTSYGFEVFHDPAEGYYTVRLHIRTYDGTRVASSWTSGEARLNAQNEAAAKHEVTHTFRDWRASLDPATD
jgi:hypothetical protein